MQSNAVKPKKEKKLGNSYIPHPMAEEAKQNIKILFDAEPCEDHAWAGLLVGPTGSGKSAVVRRFRKEQSERDRLDNFEGESVLRVRTPDKCTNLRLYQALLQALGDPLATTRDSPVDCQAVAMKLLSRKKTKLVIFDEAQHAVPRKGVKRDAYEVANFFKDLQDEAGVNILFCGLESCRQLIQNPQLESRAYVEANMTAFDWWKTEEDDDQRGAFLHILADMHDMMDVKIKRIDPDDDTKLVLFDVTNEQFGWRLSFGTRGLLRPVVKFFSLLESVAEAEKRQYVSEDMFKRVWSKIPKPDHASNANGNPFALKQKPNFEWQPASGAEGDRK
jgi:hypothetical protein